MNSITNIPEKGNILIVDDTPENLELLSKMLSAAGYKVRLAPSGKLALRFIESKLPDLILLDIVMSPIDGYEVCKELKASSRTKDIPVVFLSALNEVFDKVKAFSLGGVDYITKPFECQEVLVRVENHLRLSQLSRELSDRNTKLSEEIQERQRIEEALRQSEEQRRLALDLTHIGSWQWRVATGKEDWNDNMFLLLGLVPSEVESSRQTWRDRIHPDDVERVEQAINDALNNHTDYEAEYRVIYPNGGIHWLLSRGRGIYNEVGEPLRMIGVVLDICLRKQAEETLKQQKEVLQTIFDHVPVMLALFDSQSNGYLGNPPLLKWANRAWKDTLGCKIEELENQDVLSKLYPECEYRQVFFDRMIAATSEWCDFQMHIIDGRILDISWAFIRLSNGTTIGIGQNITERLIAAQRERKQAQEASILEERNRMAREIHDTLAQAFTGIIVQSGVASRVIAQAPEQAIGHMKTVRDLACSGLAEARRSVQALRPQLLEEGDLYSALNSLGTQMSLHTDTRIVLEVVGKPYPLALEVENNLLRIGQEGLTNAFKYARASLIRIELVYETTEFFLKIEDNGQGFDINSACVGNGFGLLGMTERADRIGAQLNIHSQLGEGTSVTVKVSVDF